MSEQKSAMANVQFYMKKKAAAWLSERYDEHLRNDVIPDGCGFCMEMIDRTLRCDLSAAESIVWAKLYVRSELGIYDEERPDVAVIRLSDGEYHVVADNGRVGDDGREIGLEMMRIGESLWKVLCEENLWNSLSDVDPEREGVLVKLMDDVLQFERVSGRKRPAMLCRTLFGGEQMVRPYQDEVLNAWGVGMMDFGFTLEEAEAGDEDAMERAAGVYLNGDELLGVDRDAEKAAYWFRRLAENGNAIGQFRLAELYLQGRGVEKNPEEALRWMEKARNSGAEDAAEYLEIYKKIKALTDAAAAGDQQALAQAAAEYLKLGCAVEDGDEFFVQARKAVEKAAEAEIPEALWVLAQVYEYGCGVAEDMEQALEYYRRGSELGHSACRHSLGCFYLQGDYLISDVEKGFALCLQAAEEGYGPAMQSVGRCYQFGDGVASSMKTAVEWYEKYLETNDDPEFAQQVMYFKTIPGLVDDFGMEDTFTYDYTSEVSECVPMFDAGTGFASGSIAAMMAYEEAETYERELFEQGMLPDASLPDSESILCADTFPRVKQRAEEGDARAADILATIDYATGNGGF